MEHANNTNEINIGSMGDSQLTDLSRKMLLSLDINEMKKIKMEIKSEKEIIRFTIRDWGIGLFNNIQKKNFQQRIKSKNRKS